jgi:hypothetical protein
MVHRIFHIKELVWEISKFIPNDNNLLLCNKELYELKLKYYNLTKRYSIKYMQDVDFRNLIHSKIINSRLQISLNLSDSYEVTNINALSKVHTLNLSSCYEITDTDLLSLGSVHTLNLSNCNKITEKGVEHLGNLHTLYLSYCNQITDNAILKLCHLN